MSPNNLGVLDTGVRVLETAGIETARLDCLVLLEDITGKNRAHILAHPEIVLNPSQKKAFDRQLAARVQHLPLAYIRGKAHFYGREFTVDKHVLVPRPETETMIDILTQLPAAGARIADIGTGSGCIAITAALELPEARVEAYDIDPQALAVARRNARLMHAPVNFYERDLLQGVAGPPDIIVTNLPYVPRGYPINTAAAHEPPSALFAGTDGLDDYRQLFAQLAVLLKKPVHILTESLPSQHAAMMALAQPAGYVQRADEGFIQLFERADA